MEIKDIEKLEHEIFVLEMKDRLSRDDETKLRELKYELKKLKEAKWDNGRGN